MCSGRKVMMVQIVTPTRSVTKGRYPAHSVTQAINLQRAQQRVLLNYICHAS